MSDIAALVADNLDIWTSAIERKSGAGRGSGSKRINLYGIERLRALILDLAVRGKLVQQDTADEPAAEILKRVKSERPRLIGAGKAKAGKPLLAPSEWPFTIPSCWVWAQLGQITNYGQTDKVDPGSVAPETWVLELEDVEKGTSRLLERVRCADRQFQSQKNAFQAGDVIYGKLRPYLDKVIIADEPGVCTTEMVPMRAYGDILPNYIRLFLKSPYFIALATDSAHGMNLPRLATEVARAAPIALPPFAEQRRIVAKVDELMALCDALERESADALTAHQTLVEALLTALVNSVNAADLAANWARLESHFDTLFTTETSIDALKQTILDLAVRGKLVDEDAGPESAKDLIDGLNRQHACMEKDGIIAKRKLVAFPAEWKPAFTLPSGWVWECFGNYTAELATGPFGSLIHQSDYVDDGIPLINPSHMIEDRIAEDPSVSLPQEKVSKLEAYKLRAGDMVFARRGEVGRLAIVTVREAGWLCGTGSFRARFASLNVQEYLALFFRTRYAREFLGGQSVGSTMSNLNHSILNRLPIPIPPLAEQHRIVAKVDELITLCEALKARLADVAETRRHLADAIVERAAA